MSYSELLNATAKPWLSIYPGNITSHFGTFDTLTCSNIILPGFDFTDVVQSDFNLDDNTLVIGKGGKNVSTTLITCDGSNLSQINNLFVQGELDVNLINGHALERVNLGSICTFVDPGSADCVAWCDVDSAGNIILPFTTGGITVNYQGVGERSIVLSGVSGYGPQATIATKTDCGFINIQREDNHIFYLRIFAPDGFTPLDLPFNFSCGLRVTF